MKIYRVRVTDELQLGEINVASRRAFERVNSLLQLTSRTVNITRIIISSRTNVQRVKSITRHSTRRSRPPPSTVLMIQRPSL